MIDYWQRIWYSWRLSNCQACIDEAEDVIHNERVKLFHYQNKMRELRTRLIELQGTL